MKFLIDECVWFSILEWFRAKGFDVVSVAEGFSGYTDHQVLEKAYIEKRILVTQDKDFGDMVFRSHSAHCGILFLRLEGSFVRDRVLILENFFANQEFVTKLSNNFVVLTEKSVRIVEQKILSH